MPYTCILGGFQQLTGGWIGGHFINGTTLIARLNKVIASNEPDFIAKWIFAEVMKIVLPKLRC